MIIYIDIQKMSTPCYCCYTLKQKMLLKKQPTKTELDNALNELGMLSAVTNSRQQYLEEKLKSEVAAKTVSGPSVCILQMNSNFVTDFTFSNSALLLSKGDQNVDATETSSHEVEHIKGCIHSKAVSYRARHRMLRVMPYNVPPKRKLRAFEDTMATLFTSSDTNGTASTTNPISRQDSGNKSNPGSPVKSQKNVSNSGCSIVRSRSLDDLEISNLSLSDCCSNEAGKAEIDTVSQRISNLHVS